MPAPASNFILVQAQTDLDNDVTAGCWRGLERSRMAFV
jgi:hypothetical protein